MTNPPIAPQRPHQMEKHGDVRQDPFFWMRDREDPAVIDYLNEENAYTKETMAAQADLQETLFEEMKGRIKQDDSTLPYRLDKYYYYARFEEGQEYPLHCRKRESLEAEEQVMLDVNVMAKGQAFMQVAGLTLTPDHTLLAYAQDTVGRRIYTLKVKNLETGEILTDEIPNMTGNAVWAKDGKTLFYSKQDPETLRPYQIYRHTLGTDPAKDVLVYEEQDDTFRCYITKSKSKDYLFIVCDSTLSSEVRFLDAGNPTGDFQVIEPRGPKHEYGVEHFGDHFYILTNWEALNFRLMKTPITATEKSNWTEVIPHRTDVLLEDIEIFKEFLVLSERKGGLSQIQVRPWEGESYYLPFHDPTYLAWVDTNPSFDTEQLRYGYESLTMPETWYDFDMKTQSQVQLKQKEILGGFDAENYRSEWLHATAEDGVQIPISLVYHKDTPRDGSAPLLEYGYGAYGMSMDPYFSPARLSLLDRGFIFAIAHIRGGSELGRNWYDTGKMQYKKNSFKDFIACGEHLIQAGYTSKGKLFASGGSAGGLLMGAVMNMRPDLYTGVLAAVPFVDVISTMLDESIPLTTGEYDEWGNPNDAEAYSYIRSYSPYDNVSKQDYPNLLVTSGLHDSQVQYWEPTKWVAKLRTLYPKDKLLLLHTNMDAGHGGASGRFQPYRETALEYAFFLRLAGKA
ncbi:S9 family peptidase [Pontibacter sp. G13]|uniref:S9 family peptidase n=1 Tax=Pontibacter sp. G13 TaxID=3074898 RepID=UPI002889A0E2|nr:S9 family peptidase [Pontibacter sp. G13]WNJ17243.1 S9 family peptidase [Pontibacter sp. G13]